MSDIDTLLKRLSDGHKGEAIAWENFEHNKELLLRRLDAVDALCESAEWAERRFAAYREELVAFLAKGRRLAGYPHRYKSDLREKAGFRR